MAYGTKYRFTFDSNNGAQYQVDISQDGYSGSVIKRPLGSSPIIRMQESGPFRSTSCTLKLECQVDGEFAELYTSNPREFRVEVYRGTPLVWIGFVNTEIYAEPDIHTPYDVDVTASDGLGTLKEYTFAANGALTLKNHLFTILSETGLNLALNTASSLRETADTAINFLDVEKIDLDFLAGENCYDVLGKILDTLNATITQTHGQWLIVRETDASISSGSLAVIQSTIRSNQSSTSTSMALGTTVGQMGVAPVWPVGFLTRRISPAKKEVTLQAPWHTKNGAPLVSDDGWSHGSNCTFSTNKYRLGSYSNPGTVYTILQPSLFVHVLRITVKANRVANWQYGQTRPGSYFTIGPSWYSNTDSAWYYYDSESDTWVTSDAAGVVVNVNNTNEADDISYCESFEVKVPAKDDSGTGYLRIDILGLAVDLYDITVDFDLGKGYQDRIIINNGARGSGDTVEILGGRRTADNGVTLSFLAGVWFGGASSGVPTFTDSVNSNKDFLSLTALSYAKSIAAPRIETSGVIDLPSSMAYPPLIINHHSVNSIMKTYEWSLVDDEISFKAISFPSASLVVQSETITGIPSGSSSGSSSGEGGGGGGGGGGSYTLPIASADTLGGIKVGTGLSINSTTGVLSATGGGSVSGYIGTTAVQSTSQTQNLTGIGDITANSIAGGGSSNLYIGNSGNTAWVVIREDMKSGTSNAWTIEKDGDASFKSLVVNDETINPVTANPTVPSGTTPTALTRLKIGSGYYSISGGGGGGNAVVWDTETSTTVELDVDGVGKVLLKDGALSGYATESWVGNQGFVTASTLADYVTIATAQTITGEKTFTTKPVNIGSSSCIKVNSSSYIDIGPLRLKYDAGSKGLHITKADSNDNTVYSLYADGAVSAGGVHGDALSLANLADVAISSPSAGQFLVYRSGNWVNETPATTVKYVSCANDAAYNAISPKDPSTLYAVGSPVTKVYLGSFLLKSS